MRTVIVGAGIGGLSTALSLHASGFEGITVYERSERIRGLGVGINLLPHAVREPTELGVADLVAAHGLAPQRARCDRCSRRDPGVPDGRSRRRPTVDVRATVLLGDAAHAMYPNGSNGGSQAILDARMLAHCLATRSSVDEALAAYEAERRPVTAALLASTRRTGPERVMTVARERAPHGFDRIDDVIPLAERTAIADDYKRAVGFHPAVLNERASLTARVSR